MAEKQKRIVKSLAEIIVGPPHVGGYEVSARADLIDPQIFAEKIDVPEVEMLCGVCQWDTKFSGSWFCTAYDLARRDTLTFRPAVFVCKNCSRYRVQMSFHLSVVEDDSAPRGQTRKLRLIKGGQSPAYSVPVPQKLRRFIQGNDWDLYRKGRNAESMGLGIAASVYYRRVVENNLAKLIDRMIEVAKETNEAELLEQLQEAKTNWRFTDAASAVRVPRRLLIGSENPMTLLHDAFSDGVHNLSDEEFLAKAHAGRAVLEHLVTNIGAVMDDKKSLQEHVQTLRRRKPAADDAAGATSAVPSDGEGEQTQNRTEECPPSTEV